jgi:Na+-driven multidrug efflux pump
LIFGTLLCHTKIQIKFEFGFDPLIFHEVMALGLEIFFNELSVLSTFSHIRLIFGTLLCHTKIQIKFEFGFDPLIFHEVMALGLEIFFNELSVLSTFFSYSFDIWYIALPYQDTD